MVGFLKGESPEAWRDRGCCAGVLFMRAGQGQAICNRDAHVRRTELRNHRAVAEFDQTVDNRLRMDDDVELFRSRSAVNK